MPTNGSLFPDLIGQSTGDGRDHLDRYYTPDALAARLVPELSIRRTDRVLEPHAGGGAFVRAARYWTPNVHAIDIDPEASGLADATTRENGDFLNYRPDYADRPAWIVGNPPYANAEDHLHRAMDLATVGVAFLLRLAFLESSQRWNLWSRYDLDRVLVLAQRPSFTDGGTDNCAYAFFVWRCSRLPTWGRTFVEARLEVISWR